MCNCGGSSGTSRRPSARRESVVKGTNTPSMAPMVKRRTSSAPINIKRVK